MEYIITALIIIIAYGLFTIITKKAKKETPQSANKWDFNAYKLYDSILTKREFVLYELLIKEIPETYTVCPKVGIKDFIQITEKKDYMKHFGRISQKSVKKKTLNHTLE